MTELKTRIILTLSFPLRDALLLRRSSTHPLCPFAARGKKSNHDTLGNILAKATALFLRKNKHMDNKTKKNHSKF